MRLFCFFRPAVGLAPALFFAFLSPAEFFKNILLFNLIRSPDPTSMRRAARPGWSGVSFWSLFVAVAAYVGRQAPTLRVRCGLGVMLTLGAILCGPGSHQNYQLWWLPFYSLLVALALTGVRPTHADSLRARPATACARPPRPNTRSSLAWCAGRGHAPVQSFYQRRSPGGLARPRALQA